MSSTYLGCAGDRRTPCAACKIQDKEKTSPPATSLPSTTVPSAGFNTTSLTPKKGVIMQSCVTVCPKDVDDGAPLLSHHIVGFSVDRFLHRAQHTQGGTIVLLRPFCARAWQRGRVVLRDLVPLKEFERLVDRPLFLYRASSLQERQSVSNQTSSSVGCRQ